MVIRKSNQYFSGRTQKKSTFDSCITARTVLIQLPWDEDMGTSLFHEYAVALAPPLHALTRQKKASESARLVSTSFFGASYREVGGEVAADSKEIGNRSMSYAADSAMQSRCSPDVAIRKSRPACSALRITRMLRPQKILRR